MTHEIRIRGYALDKNGKLVRRPHRQSVSERLRQKHSKRVKPVKHIPGVT